MAGDYKIVSMGKAGPDRDAARVKARLAKIFKTDVEKIEPLLSGRRVTIKKGLSQEEAQKYQTALESAGLVCRAVTAESHPPKSEPGPEPEDIKVCPRCGHEAQGPNDSLLSQGECPKCGVILAKAIAARESKLAEEFRNGFESAISAAITEKEAESRLEDDFGALAALPTASLKTRALAGAYTSIICLSIFAIFGFILVLIERYRYNEFFQGLAAPARTWPEWRYRGQVFMDISSEIFMVGAIMFFLILWALTVNIPTDKGAAWGQRLVNHRIILLGGRRPGLGSWSLRFLGHLISICTFGLGALVQVIHPKKYSLADLFSKTRSIQEKPGPRNLRFQFLAPLVGFVIIFGLTGPLSLWLLPSPRAKPPQHKVVRTAPRSQLRANSLVLSRVAVMQTKHKEKFNYYAGDLNYLLEKNASLIGPKWERKLRDMAGAGKLRLERLGTGFTAGIYYPEHQAWLLWTETGSQGVKQYQWQDQP